MIIENTQTQILPLYYFFERLRQNEFLLGIDDYEYFISACQFELGIDANNYSAYLDVLEKDGPLEKEKIKLLKKTLFRLSRILWLKPNQSLRLFEDLFEDTFYLDFRHLQVDTEKSLAETLLDTKKKQEDLQNVTPEEEIKINDITEVQGTTQAKDDQEKETDIKPVFVRIGMSEKQNKGQLGFATPTIETEKSKFLFSDLYFPVDRRKIHQNLRALPMGDYEYNTAEIDVEATIKRQIEKGFFTGVVTKKQKSHTNNIVLFIDHQGSMVAFQQMAQNLFAELKNVLLPDKKFSRQSLKTYYFFNIISEHVFINTTHTRYELLDKVLERLRGKSAHIIIISDAGAARGNNNSIRVNNTKNFILKFRHFTHKIVWLNPMPKNRWINSSARVIAENVAMYEANENGIKNAVDFLKGSSTKIIQMS